MFILTQVFPPINILMPYTGAIQVAIFVIVFLFLCPVLIGSKCIVWLFVSLFISLVYYLMGNAYLATINDLLVPFLQMLSGLLIAEYAIKYDSKYVFTRIVVFTIIVANVILALITIPQLMLFPHLLRDSYSSESEGLEMFIWIMSYSTIHGIPLLIAPLGCLCIKMWHINKIKFLIWVAISGVLLAVVYFSNATTALFISIIALALAFFCRFEKFTRKNLTRLGLLGILSIILMQPAISVPIIRALQNTMDPLSTNYEKMSEIENSIVYGEQEGDLGGRIELYESSQKLFWESPLWGTSSPERIGRHSWIMDNLALYGIMFIIPLFFVFYFNFKTSYCHLKYTQVTYSLGVVCWLLLLYLKAGFGHGSWLYGFACLPLMCRYIDFIVDSNNSNPNDIKSIF